MEETPLSDAWIEAKKIYDDDYRQNYNDREYYSSDYSLRSITNLDRDESNIQPPNRLELELSRLKTIHQHEIIVKEKVIENHLENIKFLTTRYNKSKCLVEELQKENLELTKQLHIAHMKLEI